VVFLYPKKMEFAAAARAIKIRGQMQFGQNPLEGKFDYKAFFADIPFFDEKTYGTYAMLVRDFYASDIQEKFNALFPGLDCANIPATIHNPNAYMEAHRPVVERLIAQYKNTTSPLEFYGSKHMAEGIAMLMDCLTHKEMKGGILADEQGMAKTIQTIIAMKEAGMKRVLVIAPKTARATAWPNELRLVDKKITFAFGRPAAPGSRNVDFELFTWDDLRRMPNMDEIFDLEDALREQGKLTDKSMLRLTELRETIKAWASKFDCVVADEAHRAKHAGSQRSTALRNLCEFVPRILLLTGTPITKRPKDVLHGLQIINHPLAKEPKKFLARYNPENPGGWGKGKPVSKQRLEELHALLRDCYIRREKNQTNLPPKIRYVQKVELTDKELEDIEKRWENYCDEIVVVGGEKIKRRVQMQKPSYPVDLVHTMKVREWVSLNKVEALSEWADDLLEAGEKVVIFTQFTETFDAYMKKYKDIAVGINGTVSTENRVKAVDRFQKDPKIKVFIGNIQAAGEGITITAAAHLGFNDLAWLPTEMLQAEDRICRGGQTRPCGIYFFLANHEVDEDGFKDFIKSKGVVQTVTNRRDEKGEINDAEWKGETEGTAIQELGVGQQQLGGDFDWEDAGEEPPEQIEVREPTGRDFVERTIQRNLMSQAKTRGDLFGGNGRQDRQQALTVLKTSLPEGYAGDTIILNELTTLQSVLTGWNLEFTKSVIGWIKLRRKLSPKQRSKAMEIIAKNRRYLLGRK
jgi:hypothetical protein